MYVLVQKRSRIKLPEGHPPPPTHTRINVYISSNRCFTVDHPKMLPLGLANEHVLWVSQTLMDLAFHDAYYLER